jgi:hypothetical protein
MGMTVTEMHGFTEWREERLYVLHMIEDLKEEQRRQSEAAAILREKVEQKQQQDIKVAHDRIRADGIRIKALENARITMGIKNWILTLALGAAGAIAIELAKAWLVKKW